MISTVTTSTVSTISTVTIAGSVAMIGILVLLFLLIQKELASAATGTRYKTLTKVLDIGIMPLILAFLVVVFTRVAEILR
jgi:hypothetical protein